MFSRRSLGRPFFDDPIAPVTKGEERPSEAPDSDELRNTPDNCNNGPLDVAREYTGSARDSRPTRLKTRESPCLRARRA
jgi:hypothetical protein